MITTIATTFPVAFGLGFGIGKYGLTESIKYVLGILGMFKKGGS